MTAPCLEAFIMAEDIRFEKSGQFTLTGVLSDKVFSKLWPLAFPKVCFQVRVRDVGVPASHSLAVSRLGSDTPLVTLGGEAEKGEGVNIFNYFIAGLAFPEPGPYSARFTVRKDGDLVFAAEYIFTLVNPNAEELYVQCTQCKIKYGSGIVANSPSQIGALNSVCPQCGTANPMDSKSAFHLPNPK